MGFWRILYGIRSFSFFIVLVTGSLSLSFSQGIKVYSLEAALSQDNKSEPRIYIENTGTENISDITLRYFLKAETGTEIQVEEYHTPQSSVTKQNAEDYVYIRYEFTGVSLSPGERLPDQSGNSVGIYYSDWSSYNKEDDFSNNISQNFEENPNIAVYSGGEKIYGNTPDDGGSGAEINITKQPESITVAEGQAAEFSVEAENSESLTYQWYCAGEGAIQGEEGSILVFERVSPDMDGNEYFCILGNQNTSLQSESVVCNVKTPTSRTIIVSGELYDYKGYAVGYEDTKLMDMVVRLYPALSSDSAVYREGFYADSGEGIKIRNGRFFVRLGKSPLKGRELLETVRTHPNLFISFSVARPGGNMETLRPYTPLTASPYSFSGYPELLRGGVDPVSAGLEAPVGTHYLDEDSGTTYIKTENSWAALD
ncbi:MAG: immunoglobulin domain-containing protein [Chitinivibrionales bacterium]